MPPGKISLQLRHDPKSATGSVTCAITALDPNLLNHRATLRVELCVKVHDKRPIHNRSELWCHQFDFHSKVVSIEIPRERLQVYSYRGKMIDLELHFKVVVDNGWMIDTTISQEQELSLGLKPLVNSDSKEIIDPQDAFSFMKNLRAIPAQNQLVTIGLCVVGIVLVVVNTLIGIHDQFVPEVQTYLYSHFDSDGDSNSPLFNAIGMSGAFGFAIWLAIRTQLRKYMDFFLLDLPNELSRNTWIELPLLVSGNSRVPLHNVTLRVVACNLEMGQYTRGSGSNRRTVSFKEPVRALVLYEKRVKFIPARTEVTQYFNEHFPLGPLFEVLYPPCKASSSHGLAVYWEIQFIHEDFVDQEVACPDEKFAFSDFFSDDRALTDKLFR